MVEIILPKMIWKVSEKLMTYEFAKYPDGTLGVFSNIGKKENGEEYMLTLLSNCWDVENNSFRQYKILLLINKLYQKKK